MVNGTKIKHPANNPIEQTPAAELDHWRNRDKIFIPISEIFRNTFLFVFLFMSSFADYAPRPWGMQPNTSLVALSSRFPWAFLCTCLCAYYTIFALASHLAVVPYCLLFWNIWYNCLIKLNACWFVRTKSLLSLDNGPRAGCGKVNLPRPVCGMLSGCSGPRMDILHRAPRLSFAASNRL